MPTYEYLCRACGTRLEVVQSFADDALTVCDGCGGELRKVFSAAGLIFKGSGWHIKDYSGSTSGTSSSGSSTKSEGSKSDGSKSDGSSSEKKSAGKDGATASPAPSSPGTSSGTSSGTAAKSSSSSSD